VRYAYAKWLVDLTEEHGLGLADGEFAEVAEAEFRVYGLSAVADETIPKITSNVAVDDAIPAWEAELLGSVAHELIPVFDPKKGNNDGR
jgi:hypothetical protein